MRLNPQANEICWIESWGNWDCTASDISSSVSSSKRKDPNKVWNKICPSFGTVVGRLGELWIAYLKDGLNS